MPTKLIEVLSALRELTATYGRGVSLDELADYFGVEVADVATQVREAARQDLVRKALPGVGWILTPAGEAMLSGAEDAE